MVQTALIIIESKPRSPEDLLEEIINMKKSKKKKEEAEKILQVGIYLPCVSYFFEKIIFYSFFFYN